MQHAASHTTAVQPSSHNQRHVLIGKQWYQLPELIPTNSKSDSPIALVKQSANSTAIVIALLPVNFCQHGLADPLTQ